MIIHFNNQKMDEPKYVSCIKINGVPILPPMMTSDIREEMNYYKKLAVAVEEKLRFLHRAKEAKKDKSTPNVKADCSDKSLRRESPVTDIDDLIHSDTDSVSLDSTPNTQSIIHMPVHDVKDIATREEQRAPVFEPDSISQQPVTYWKMKLDKEKSSPTEMHISDSTSPCSESVTMSTDLNQYLNISNSAEVKSNTTETTPETWKPQVPKTLDIIPITLDSSNKTELENNCKIMSKEDETPKLIRQGSYVLDTPSPMLLAHMQTNLGKDYAAEETANTNDVPNAEYVRTPTANTIRRKEWNILQAKNEWENQIKNRELIIADPSQRSNGPKCKKHCSFGNQRKSSCQQTKQRPLGMYQSTRSVDCIQAMLAKEYICRSNSKINYCNQKCINGKSQDHQKWNTNKNISVLNLANKLGGSLGSLNSGDVQSCKHVEIKQRVEIQPDKHSEEKANNPVNIEDTTSKLRSTITSEKLLAVFKEIEEMHKKQMTELVIRQQREQSLLQKEFEKQQYHVLTEIKKSFPGISLQSLPKKFPSVIPDETISVNGTASESSFSPVRSKNSAESPETLKEAYAREVKSDQCPLDYLYPKTDDHIIKSPSNQCCQSTQTSQVRAWVTTNGLIIEKKSDLDRYQPTHDSSVQSFKPDESKESKHSNVSRQLFPLDTKTTRVPILDGSVYTEKHIRAATVINAYAKGYLVRRIMQTDRVIALKNTYKEALHCMLKLHIDAPLNLPELNFLHRLQLQCDAASMNIVELFNQSPPKRMQIIAHDREIKRSRTERPTSARSYSFATQRTLARKKLKEMGDYPPPLMTRSCSTRSRCQTWTSDIREKITSPSIIYQTIKRSTSAGAVRKPWR